MENLKKEKIKKDIILIFDGGCMRGVFEAGVGTQFCKNGIYERVHSVYGISAGAHIGAFFITKECKKVASICYDDFSEKPFFYDNKTIAFSKLMLRIFKKNTRLYTSIGLNRLINIEKTTKKLNTKKLLSSDIKFFIKVFNVKKKNDEYLNTKQSIFRKLKASSAIPPLYPKQIKIRDIKYIDGAALSPILDLHLRNIIKNNKNKKIILICNYPLKGINNFKKKMEDLSLGFLLLCYFKKLFVIRKTISKVKYNSLKEYSKFSNLYIINSEIYISSLCADKDEFLKLYNHGIEKAKKFNFKNKLT